jgi:hypothetical protein
MSTLPARFLVAASAGRLAPEGLALAVVLLTVERTGSARSAGLVVAATTLPQIVVGPAVGPALDRATAPWRRLAVAAAGNALVVAGLVAAVGRLPLAAAVALALLVSITDPLLSGGLSAIAGATAPASRRDRIQVWDSFAYNVAGLVAPAMVTVLAATLGATAALVALAAGSAVAAAALAAMHDGATVSGGSAATTIGQLAAAARAILGSRPLCAVTVATTLAQASSGALPFAAVAAARWHGRDETAAGALVTAIAVGAFAGSALMTRSRPLRRPDRVVLWSLTAMGAGMVAIAWSPWPALLVAACVLGGLDAPLLVATFAARARLAPRPAQATVFTLGAGLKLGASSIGALAGGLLIGDRSTGWGLAAIGAAHLVAAAVGAAVAGVGPDRSEAAMPAR